MGNAERKRRKRAREPWTPPAEKEPTSIFRRNISETKLVKEIINRGIEGKIAESVQRIQGDEQYGQ